MSPDEWQEWARSHPRPLLREHMTEVGAIVRRIASFGLRRRYQPNVSPEVPDALWSRVLSSVADQRITGLASAAAKEDALLLSEAQREELLDRHRSAMAMVLLLEDLLSKVSSAMANAEVQAVVLKGPAVAHAFYPHPSWRSYGDVDLLIAGADWRRACAVLSDLGFHRLIPEPRRGFDERFGKGASFENAQALQVDLHRTLALGPFGLWIDPQALLRGTTEFRPDRQSFRRLDDTNALIHACIHAALGRQEPLLVPSRDVAQIAWSGSIDWELMSERTREWKLEAVVTHAMGTTADLLGALLPEETEQLIRREIPWIERRALAAYTTDRARRGGASLAALWAIPGIGPRAAYVGAMLFPEERFRTARQQGSRPRRSRLMIPIRWAVDRIRADRRG